MKEKVLLPFEYAPEAFTYHFVGFPLGIIQGNANQNVIPWLSSRYINCRYSTTLPCQFAYFDADNWAVEDKVLFHQHINLHQEQFSVLTDGGHTLLLKKMLQLGYYPHGMYNEEFIPGKKSYNNRYYEHDFIICGYDDGIGSFISAGYLSDEKFQRYTIPYKCMERALTTLRNNEVMYNFWKYNREATYQLNCPKIVQHLYDYLNSVNSQSMYASGCTWGLQAILDTGSFLIDLYEKKKRIEHRCTRAVMEHKKLMYMRISCLQSCSILNDQEYLDFACEAFRLSKISHLLGVKSRFTKDMDIAFRINDNYQKIVSLEKSYLPCVLADMQHSVS